MTVPEYIQLRAFARVDGARLALLWVASFACYVWGLRTPELGLLSMGLALATPFYCTRRLRRFKADALDGQPLSFGRGYAYVVFMFLYACLLFAAAQFVYFNFIDKGYFIGAISDMMAQATSAATVGTALGAMVQEGIEALRAMRPIDLVFNILMSNMMIGALVALPVAAIGKSGNNSNIKQ